MKGKYEIEKEKRGEVRREEKRREVRMKSIIGLSRVQISVDTVIGKENGVTSKE